MGSKRLLRACAVAVVVAGAVMLLPAAPAHADKVYGYDISRSEVIARAHYWLSVNVPYDQNGAYPDPEGRNYRPDCAGFVAMAWHLNYDNVSMQHDYWTATLPNVSSTISKSSLKPGDVMMINWNLTSGHVVMFEKWTDSTHTRANIIAEANDDDDMDYYQDEPISDYSGYTAFRYDNIFDDASVSDTASRGLVNSCANTALADPTIDLPDRRDMYIAITTCITSVYAGGGNIYTYTGWITVHWEEGRDADDSSDTSKPRFDTFSVGAQVQKDNHTQAESVCSLTSEMNASYTGTRSCAVSFSTPATGSFTADGYVHWNSDGDGKYWLKPAYVQGSSSA